MNIFISHSTADREFAEDLASRLVEAGHAVWRDGLDVSPGENIALRSGRALERSDAMIVLLSPDAVESRWVRGEIEYALSSPKFEGRLIPVVVRPTKRIPWILRTLSSVRLYRDPRRGRKLIVDRLRHLAKAAG
jgi:hypothetical protein